MSYDHTDCLVFECRIIMIESLSCASPRLKRIKKKNHIELYTHYNFTELSTSFSCRSVPRARRVGTVERSENSQHNPIRPDDRQHAFQILIDGMAKTHKHKFVRTVRPRTAAKQTRSSVRYYVYAYDGNIAFGRPVIVSWDTTCIAKKTALLHAIQTYGRRIRGSCLHARRTRSARSTGLVKSDEYYVKSKINAKTRVARLKPNQYQRHNGVPRNDPRRTDAIYAHTACEGNRTRLRTREPSDISHRLLRRRCRV